MKYAINGRFLSQRVTGVQRFEREIVKALDNLVSPNEICLAVPKNYDSSFCLKNIKIIIVGNTTGIFWEQTTFFAFILSNKLTGINLGNVAPLLKPDIVCIHDIKLVLNPEWFNWKYVVWSKLNYVNALKRGKLVLTVSDFSKKEIERVYPSKKVDIKVLDEGWQHMNSIQADERALAKYGLEPKEFFFSLYQSIPNKNFRWIINAAKNNPDQLFVVSGWNNKRTNISEIDFEEIDRIHNLKVLGFITDEEMKSLLINCKAFIYPSLYEGFGLPPLEALSVGTHVMVMDIPIMREVLEDSAQYISNDKYDIKINDIDYREGAVLKHSWENGARLLKSFLET